MLCSEWEGGVKQQILALVRNLPELGFVFRPGERYLEETRAVLLIVGQSLRLRNLEPCPSRARSLPTYMVVASGAAEEGMSLKRMHDACEGASWICVRAGWRPPSRPILIHFAGVQMTREGGPTWGSTWYGPRRLG